VATDFDLYAPFDDGPGADVTEDTWRAMMRRGNIAGVARNVLNELRVTANGSGMQVFVDTGESVIESYWGQSSGSKTLGITSNASGSTRYDMVVARADWVLNKLVFDVNIGTASGPPFPTRDNTKWEVPLAVVAVTNGAVTILATQVYDCRQWGGPPVITVPDDYSWYGDKISSATRLSINGDAPAVNTNLYVVRLQSLGEQMCSKIRMCPSVLPVGGTTQVRIFYGARLDMLTSFIDPTTSTFLYGGSAGAVHESAFTPRLFRAGENIAIAVRGASTTTAATLINCAATSTVSLSAFLNPDPVNGPMVTTFKTNTMPTNLNLLDGTWSNRDRVWWAALA
jgi:hypothetical protein